MCDDLDMVMVGNRIKERRKELHLNQTDIYDKCGITPGALSRIENGLNVPSISLFYKLAQVLECNTDWLMHGYSSIQETQIYEKEEKLFRMFLVLSEDDKEEIETMIELKYKRLLKNKEKEERLSHLEETISNNNIA